jgi:hypothetical protein
MMSASITSKLYVFGCAVAMLTFLAPNATASNGDPEIPYTQVNLNEHYKRKEKPPSAPEEAVAYTEYEIKSKGQLSGDNVQFKKEGDKFVASFKEGKSLQVEAYLNTNNSWVERGSDGKPTEDAKSRASHEQRHLDIAKIEANAASAEVKTYTAEGKTAQEALQALADKVTKRMQDSAAKAVAEGNTYDEQTANGTKPAEQKKWDEKVDNALKKPNKDEKKDVAKADSQSGKSLLFDAATGILSLTGDVIVNIDPLQSGFVPSASDPIFGASVILGDFRYLGAWGPDSVFFGPVTDGAFAISEGELLQANVDYLLYDRGDNALYGVVAKFSGDTGKSPFLDHLFAGLSGDDEALMYLSLFPAADLALLTADFTSSGATAMNNSIGAGKVETNLIPEPSTAYLLAAALALLGVGRWKPCRGGRK